MINYVDVIERLRYFGYDVMDNDMSLIDWTIRTIEEHIKSYCNISEVPEALLFKATDAVVGEILATKLRTKKLPQIEAMAERVQSMSQGDVSVSYATGISNEDMLLSCFDGLKLQNDDLNRYRCLVW